MLVDGRDEPLLRAHVRLRDSRGPPCGLCCKMIYCGRAASEDELNKLKSDYTRLSPSTAERLLEFWCEHQRTRSAIAMSAKCQ